MHLVANRVQTILGYIELAESDPEEANRKQWFDRARTEIHDLAALLQANVTRGKKVDE